MKKRLDIRAKQYDGKVCPERDGRNPREMSSRKGL
jgi:hypothetical protein